MVSSGKVFCFLRIASHDSDQAGVVYFIKRGAALYFAYIATAKNTPSNLLLIFHAGSLGKRMRTFKEILCSKLADSRAGVIIFRKEWQRNILSLPWSNIVMKQSWILTLV